MSIAPAEAVAAAAPVAAPRQRRRSLVVAAAVAAAGVGCGLAWVANAPDDSYIAWRYAANLAAGDGFCFNVGEPVDAATSPAYVLLVAVAAWLTGVAADGCARVLFVALLALGGVLAFALGRSAGAPRWLAAGVAVVFLLLPVHRDTSGMETQLQAVLMLATWIGCQRRAAWGGFAFGLAVLARPDALVFVAACAALAALRSPRLPVATLAWWLIAGGAVLLPWAAFARHEFGSVLPHTLAAKVAQGEAGWWDTQSYTRRLQTSFATFDTWRVLGSYKPMFGWFAGALVLAGAARAILPFTIYAVVHTAAYAALGVPFFHWYALPAQLVVAFAPLALLRVRAPLGATMAAVAVGVPLLVLACVPHVMQPQRSYVAAAEWLRANTPPATRFAAAEIGILGYHSRPRALVDLSGLITPAAIPAIRRREFTWPLQRDDVDVYVLHDPPWPRLEGNLVDAPGFRDRYAPVPDSPPGLMLWRRR